MALLRHIYYTPTAKPDKKLESLLDIVCNQAETLIPTIPAAPEIKNQNDGGALAIKNVKDTGGLEICDLCEQEQSTTLATTADERKQRASRVLRPAGSLPLG